MADIKTRQSNKGTIRTIDRASAMTSHVKDVHARTKEEMLHSRDQGGQQESSQASDQMGREVERSARAVATYGTDTAKAGYRQIKSKESILRRQAEQKMAEKEVGREATVIRTREKTAFASGRQRVSRRPVRTVRKPAGSNLKKMRKQYQMQKYSRSTARLSRKAAAKALRSIRSLLESTKLLITSLTAGGSIALIIILVFVLFGAAFYTFGDDSADNYVEVSPEVQAYSPLISKYAKQYGIEEYVELIKAVMMQESGGRGNDPMQCSESPYNKKYPKKSNGIKDPKYSINCGVHYLADCLKKAKCKSPVDMSHIRLALQGYNYGNGYISWAIKRDGGYTVANAIAFSDMQAKKHGWDSYGDKQYPAHVLRYYPYGSYNIGVGNTAVVQVAAKEIGNHGGKKFWSWYGYSSRVAGCGCSVSWCETKCGYIKSGTIPKFSSVP
ncbi:MAG: lysozyme family protein, partial [Firmicutes bacterium]|nr:lysozyme family protein [Bacillota bacterium]